ncbi:MAG: hypothetical protein HY647_09275 [Acidobacteria bacterium]|nr:hypothetical protein [Acidobacteriota bacterium]
MPPDSQARFYLEYDPRLVEEAVLLSLEGHPEEMLFRRERDRIYELADAEEREGRFRKFHGQWFVRLQLGRPLVEALEEQSSLMQPTRRCCVLPAISTVEEGADLHDWLGPARAAGQRPTAIAIRLQTRRLLEPTGLQAWLRQELMHLADMLDPNFGYERWAPTSDLGPAHAYLVRDRYRVLWNTWIDGRLHRRGWLPEAVREKRLAEFLATFPMLGSQAEDKYHELWESDSQTHASLMAFAQNPAGHADASRQGVSQSQVCPLCRFPTFQLVRSAADLSQEALGEIAADFPNWQPEQSLCSQCAELYRVRRQSRAAEAALPRI